MGKKSGFLALAAGVIVMAWAAWAPAASAAGPTPTPTAGRVLVRGTGVLDAQGDGLAAVRGKMALRVSASEGVLLVRDMDNDAVVNVKGDGRTVQWNGFTVYFGFQGEATVVARDAAVIVVGKDINLHVEGRGWAFLKGRGTFTANGQGPFPWTEAGTFGSVTP
ncbi:MAG: hypothetical protein HYX50_05520 [Chloroflexi bacterium]|nr:hypothetical protein [Chloroflexota bacterium]